MNTGKWSVGKYQSVVVSDTKIQNTNFPSPPNEKESHDGEINHYGGYLVAESIGNEQHAKLIAAAPDLLEALQIVIGDIQQHSVKYTRYEKLNIAKAAIKKATE